MNKERRRLMYNGISIIKRGVEILKEVSNDEQDAFDNLPEGLQQTMRGEKMEENVDILEESISEIENALEELIDIN